MVIGLLITFSFLLFLWLVFVKFKLLKFSPAWALVSAFFVVHVLLLFVIAPRFFQPASRDVRVIRNNVQLVPRLPEPTLLTDVLIEPDTHVKKGTPLFQFDKRIYEYRVEHAQAQIQTLGRPQEEFLPGSVGPERHHAGRRRVAARTGFAQPWAAPALHMVHSAAQQQ